MAFEWTDLIEPGLGLAGSLVGQRMQSGANKESIQESARQFDAKTARSDAARSMLMPVLAKNLGYKRPPVMGPSTGYGAPAPAQQSSGGGGLGGVLKKVGSVAGLTGMVPGIGGSGMLGALPALATNPIGWAAGAGLGAVAAAKKIGQGRKAADRLTGEGGAQGNFSALLQEIARREAAGQITPEQRQQALMGGLDQQIQSGLGSMKNDKDRLVMRQWLGDFSKENWMRDHPYLQAVAQKYAGSF